MVAYESRQAPRPVCERVQDRRREELGKFLRARRAQLAPEDFGLPGGSRRRTPGLRREELALLAGVGVTWYTWLEQGREINASVQVLDALARTLRLDRAEREHLYWLAEASPLLTGAERVPVPAEVLEIVTRSTPAGHPDQRPVRHPPFEQRFRRPLLGLARDAVHSQEHAVVLRHRAERPGEVPPVRAGGAVPGGAAAGRLRQARRRPGLGGGHPPARQPEPGVRRPVGQARGGGPQARVRTFVHPQAGPVTFTVTELEIPVLPEARLTVYTPVDEQTRSRLPLTRRAR